MARPLLAITLGDPNGIGPEVVLKASRDPRTHECARLVAVGSADVLRRQSEQFGFGPVLQVASPGDAPPDGSLAVWDPMPERPQTFEWGKVSAGGGDQAMHAVAAACDLCLQGAVDGMVTAPLSKEAIHRAGHAFPGHTEFLQARTGARTVVMVLASDLAEGPLRVALVTIHVPVAEVAGLVTETRIVEVATTLVGALEEALGIERPRLAMLGLNPHAGDGGVIGREEIEVLGPALSRLRQLGQAVEGPFAADAFFGRGAWTRFDAVLAMYHDQGLAPFKALAMGGGVNMTLGLPIVRTSPDHGTGFDIAGQGRADPRSTVEAIRTAAQMAWRRAEGRA